MNKSILIIDDDDMIAIQLEGVLGDFFDITHATNGAEGLALAQSLQPDLILLDVEMPDQDGYAVCKELKHTIATEQIPVIFISAHASNEDRLAGYDAGGDDYVIKPFAPDVLRRKVSVVLRNQQKNEDLAAKAASATSVATMAIASIGDSARVLNFIREIVALTGYVDIAEATLRALEEYELDACIQLRSRNGALSRNHAGFCSTLEESVLTNMAECARIVTLGHRSAFNYQNVSVIVNNMPRGNVDQYGRIKDNVATIAEIVDIRMNSLDLLLESINRGDTLLNLLHRNAATLREIEKRHETHRRESAAILNQLAKDIEDFFYLVGLNENQEQYLQKMIFDATDRAQALYDEAIKTDVIMKSLGSGLDEALQQEIQGAAQTSLEETSRIELF